MEKKKKRNLLVLATGILLLAAIGAGTLAYLWFGPQFHPDRTVYIYIDTDDTVDSIYNKIETQAPLNTFARTGFRWMVHYRHYEQHVHTGRYAIRPGESIYHVLSRLLRGYQEPMNLVVGSVRQLDRLAQHIGRQLMTDSADIATLWADSARMAAWGYNRQTLPALFIPNTYQVYWNMSVERFFERVQAEHNRFWNDERKNKAKTMGMTLEEVCTLASIVEEETNNNAEKPMVAGLYMNRLHRRIPLQADPTIKFALQEFGLRRILNAHLKVDSPYNTYRHIGLPPGPIRIPTPVGIDAVLNYVHHNYIYMCAKEDFSGTHNFSSTYSEHLKNARKYRAALNKRKIFS